MHACENLGCVIHYHFSLTGNSEPLRFVDVDTECDGVVTRHAAVDERLIQSTRRDDNFVSASRSGENPNRLCELSYIVTL